MSLLFLSLDSGFFGLFCSFFIRLRLVSQTFFFFFLFLLCMGLVVENTVDLGEVVSQWSLTHGSLAIVLSQS